MMTPDRLSRHFHTLAKESHVSVCTSCATSFRDGIASVDAHGDDHRICMSPIKGDMTYAIAMHELGHIRHPQGAIHGPNPSRYLSLVGQPTTWDVELLLISELSAWEWAKRHALIWTPMMTRVYRYGITSYERHLKNPGLKIADELDAKLQTYKTPREAAAGLAAELFKTMPDLAEMMVGLLGMKKAA